jgi:hypothetical protein
MPIATPLSNIVTSAVTPKGMQLRSNVPEPGWTFWERRTLNIHRVVGLSRADRRFTDARALDTELRATFARNFTRAWWRGIAYGAVVNVGTLTLTPDDLKILVDEYENEKGTMQWVILLTGDAPKATGVHTWIEGFLSPVYRSVLQALSDSGYQIESVMKEKNGLMRFLTAVADARTRAYTGHAAFPEFRDPFRNQKSHP